MHVYQAKSSRFESTDFASVVIDDVDCSRRHQCPQCALGHFIRGRLTNTPAMHPLVNCVLVSFQLSLGGFCIEGV